MKYLSFSKSSKHTLDLNELLEATNIDIAKPLPLEYTWVIWEQVSDNRIKQYAHYKDYTKELSRFSSVQEFWELWNRLPQPSDLLAQGHMSRVLENGTVRVIDALMIFRSNIEPMWEDEANQYGGHVEYKILPKDFPYTQVDEFWNNIVLAIVGCSLKHYNLITGVRLVDKLQSTKFGFLRIEIWYTKIENDEMLNELMSEIDYCISYRLDGTNSKIPKSKNLSHSYK
ncbi:eukaryotic translation initiation factor 4E, putative [Hepatocystis sp. ex Piliocolobus tephrosceles]|nr:eukaryotic translation initiation factor 4E, putative [Hepatocystis sp. ex Piliocolobus tephrosceles]